MEQGRIYVPSRGPLTARVVIIGEAPGRQEVLQRAPFVGPSGQRLSEWIKAAGLDPRHCYYTNTYPYLPPGGDIDAVPLPELGRWQEDCQARLDDLAQAEVLVPVGNVAMATLLGLPLAKLRGQKLPGIVTRRGSLYHREQRGRRLVTVIPTIHPAAILREKPEWEGRCRADWAKIARELAQPGPVPPPRTLLLDPPEGVRDGFLDYVAGQPPEVPLAIDIETHPHPDRGKILCIAFAASPTLALCLPWARAHLPLIQALCQSPRPKVLQNGQYDCTWLHGAGLAVVNWAWDTLAMHHCLEPLEPHSLAYLASIYTREPWYKGGDEETGEKEWARGVVWDDLLAYCAKDAAVTWECWRAMERLLVARGLLDQYRQLYQALFGPILDCMREGLLADRAALTAQYERLTQEALEAREQCEALTGEPPYRCGTKVEALCWQVHRGREDLRPALEQALARVKGTYAQYVARVQGYGVSTQWLQRVLYGHYGLPVQKHRKTKRPTTDEEALLKLRVRHGGTPKYARAIQVIDQVLRFRHQQKQSEFVNPARLDADGRLRGSYTFLPVTNRLSSSKHPRGRGGNLQNISRDIRGAFVAPEGRLLLETDLSQAEARVVYCLSQDPRLIALAQTRPWEFDVHRYNAGVIYHTSEQAVTDAQRYLAKRVVHASNYGLGADKFSAILLKDGVVLDTKACQALQEAYFAQAGAILDWQRRVRVQLLTTRTLTNAWGRAIQWAWHRLGDDLYRAGYAWGPQSDIGIHLNQGWVRLHAWARAEGLQSAIVLQCHDALLWEAAPQEVWAILEQTRQVLEAPHPYYGVRLSIPVEFKLGRCWGKAMQALPAHLGRDEVEARLRDLCTSNGDVSL